MSQAATAPAAPAPSRLVAARLRMLRDRIAGDAVLAEEVAAFLVGEWSDDGSDVVARAGERWCRLSATEISIGHDRWAGSKRIPL